ncbi:MAG: AMP-binding protein [Ekhidna sp.]
MSLKLDEIPKVNISNPNFTRTEKSALKLAKLWHEGASSFEFTTSGSTGKAKHITISRELIEYSTQATFAAIDPDHSIKTSLLCLNPSFIGGAMVVFRALIAKQDLYIIEPASQLTDAFKFRANYDLVSMVPLQFKSLPAHTIEQFGTILIGGAPMDTERKTYENNVYAAFGMTETVSHIALRKIDEELFSTTGDMEVSLSEDGCLRFKGTMTHNQWLETTDVGTCHNSHAFKWIGRKDFIINSGGIKLNPESIEAHLFPQINSPFIISSMPDNKLGEKVVLVIEGNRPKELDLSPLPKFEKPKQVLENFKIPRTASGKMDRIKTKELLRDLH